MCVGRSYLHSVPVEAEAAVRRATLILLILAALSSVVSIPVVVALVSGRTQSTTWVFIGTAIAAGLTTFLFSTVTYWKSSGEARVKETTETIKASAGSVVITVEGPAEAKLLQELSAIEREAQALLGEGPSTSVIRLRSRLLELGVWSKKDVYDFDVALRTRNEIAHGTQRDVSRTSINQAIETIRRLRQKVETSRSLEG
jgi:hypothetical protein